MNGAITESFPITTGAKQGCTTAPTLFIVYFDAMLQEALRGCDEGISIRYRADSSIFNLNWMRAKTKTNVDLIRELLYADYCGGGPSATAWQLCKSFTGFGIAISVAKTEVVYQPACTRQPLCGAKGHSSRTIPQSGLSLHLLGQQAAKRQPTWLTVALQKPAALLEDCTPEPGAVTTWN